MHLIYHMTHVNSPSSYSCPVGAALELDEIRQILRDNIMVLVSVFHVSCYNWHRAKTDTRITSPSQPFCWDVYVQLRCISFVGKERNGWLLNSACVWKYSFIACWLIWRVWFHILGNEAKHLFSNFYSRKLPMYFLSHEWWSFKQKSVITIENESILINHQLITDWTNRSLTDH